MGSVSAMARGSADRYFQKEVNDSMKLVPEGIEGRIAYKGPVGPILHQLLGGIRAPWVIQVRRRLKTFTRMLSS